MSSAAARAGPAAAAEQTLAVPIARAMAFLALCGFAALQWMQMLEPAAAQRAGYAVLAAGFAIVGLLIAGQLPGRARIPAAVLVALAAFALALLGGGVADELLRPSGWGELAAAIGRGLSTLPGARVPYRGLDESTRLVIALGGTVLAVVAALLAFWPRRGELGFRYVALVLLIALYAVPAVALDLSSEFLSGALLALLVVAYLRLERLQITDAGLAGTLAVAVTILGLAAAPLLDTGRPWFDYETWALSNASSKSTAYTWDHSYGPLDWPRDGRELLRVKAKRPAYWKATNLDDFDGTHWRRDRSSTNQDGCGDASAYLNADTDQYLQRIRVTVRNLRTQTFVTGGVTCAVFSPRVDWLPLGDGTYASSSRELRRGDAYEAIVYTPNPNGRQRRVAPRLYPATMQRYATIELLRTLPPGADPSLAARFGERIQFPLYGDAGRPTMTPLSDNGAVPVDARAFLRNSRYARTYALARRLSRAAPTQEDFVQSVMRYLGGDAFSYTESPPRAAENLDGFLFDAKSGYCQMYSGAMALLLRMGGVPARVSEGFTTGLPDRNTKEYVVRDFDAHSWVEVWYAGYGWVTFDPTPSAAPARSESDQQDQAVTGATRGAPDLGGDIRSDQGRGLTAVDKGTPWTRIGLLAATVVLLALLAFWLLRRRSRMLAAGWGPVAELERALERTRRAPGPAATLSTVEALFARTPAAAGYVRALREQRYSGRGVEPTPSGRRAVRTELARGAGPLGRLRAWWALPPKPR